jgi:hypothetical protein
VRCKDAYAPFAEGPAVIKTSGRLVSILMLVGAVLVAGGGDSLAAEPVVPPPTLPADQPAGGGAARHRVIPEGFLPEEKTATVPLSQPDVYWVRNDGPNLPPMLSPCGGSLRSDKARVDGRQLVLIGPTLWKAARLVVYRDVKAAKAAVRETRRAPRQCERHQLADGETTVWTSQALPIEDEALFAGGEQFRGDARVPGNFRGVLMRKGRRCRCTSFADNRRSGRRRPSPTSRSGLWQRSSAELAGRGRAWARVRSFHSHPLDSKYF